MPVNNCSDAGKPGYKWGDRGKCYTYTAGDEKAKGQAKKKAIIQGIATGEYPKNIEKLRKLNQEIISLLAKEAEERINGYPAATQDISINIKNRQNAIDIANYGPINPSLANDEYWKNKANVFNSSIEDAKSARCSNCAAFVKTKYIIDAMANGLGGEPMSYAIIELANLGYCDIFEFKCAGARTCDAWIAGGPLYEVKGDNNE